MPIIQYDGIWQRAVLIAKPAKQRRRLLWCEKLWKAESLSFDKPQRIDPLIDRNTEKLHGSIFLGFGLQHRCFLHARRAFAAPEVQQQRSIGEVGQTHKPGAVQRRQFKRHRCGSRMNHPRTDS